MLQWLPESLERDIRSGLSDFDHWGIRISGLFITPIDLYSFVNSNHFELLFLQVHDTVEGGIRIQE
jgi:hypothetical protein